MSTETLTLTGPQEQAVNSNSKTILALAGPGAGKTRTLVERIRRLVNEGQYPEQIIAVTFTNAAANEIQRRLGFNIGFAGTLHGLMLRLLQKYGSVIGYNGGKIGVIDNEQEEEILDRCCRELHYTGSRKAVIEALSSLGANILGTKAVKPAQLAALRFRNELLNSGLLSFDLLLSEGLRLVEQLPSLPYGHVLIDEVQDSSDIDMAIYQALPIPNKFLVGDPDQSIYAWRGGRVNHILAMEQRSDVEVIKLEANYRSDIAICEAAQNLIEHNPNRVKKATVPVSGDPGIVRVTVFPNADAEMAWVANHLQGLREFTGDGDDCAVLLKTNDRVDEWTRYLEGQGIPVARKQQTIRPSDWPFIRSALALLNDPENDMLAFWFVRQVHGETRAEAERLKAMEAGRSLNAHGLHIPPNLPIASYAQTLAQIGASQESLSIINQAIEQLAPDASGSDLLMALAELENHAQEIGEGVTVTTMHSAKGREWSSVFLPCFEEGIIPSLTKSEDMEESRRLAFVAMTRAEHNLFISYCEQRKPAYGGWKPIPVRPSRFIAEAGL